MSTTMTPLLFAGIAVLAGIASACQTHMNGTLGRSISDPVGAALWSFGSGTVMLLCIYLWRGGNLSLQSLEMTPGWAMLGGLMGFLMVLGVTTAVPNLGLLTTIAAVVLGQAIMALVLDALGGWGAGQTISVQRLAAVAMITFGLVLSRH
ncbi:MAG: DMT family transporter [Bosea sp. (in: a-proteobacteria)]